MSPPYGHGISSARFVSIALADHDPPIDAGRAAAVCASAATTLDDRIRLLRDQPNAAPDFMAVQEKNVR